jgi:hypothetical protein
VPDLREEIREYVDAIEEPVSVDDVLAVVKRGSSAGERDGRRRHAGALRRHHVLVGLGAVLLATGLLLVAVIGLEGGGVPHGSPPAAAAVLDEAAGTARAAKSLVLGPGQVLVLNESFLVDGYVSGSNGHHFYYSVPGADRWSLNPAGAGTDQITLGDPTFPSAADKAEWIALGSLPLVPSHQVTETLPLSPAQSEAQAAENGLGALPATPTVLPYNVVAALSTTPAAIEKELVDQYENGHLDVGQTFDLAANLLEEGAGSAQRSALYQMIASLPGVTFDGPTVTDVTARHGIGVSVTSLGEQRELIFDPTTSAVLEERMSVTSSWWPKSLPSPTGNTPATTSATQILAYTVFQSASAAPA